MAKQLALQMARAAEAGDLQLVQTLGRALQELSAAQPLNHAVSNTSQEIIRKWHRWGGDGGLIRLR